MNEKLGRNDPCFCGSGKKYKKCCLSKELPTITSESEVTDFQWRSLRKLEGKVFDKHLMPYLVENLPGNVFEQAMADFAPDGLPESMGEETENIFYLNFFIPWVLFNWKNQNAEFNVTGFVHGKTIAENYAALHGDRLNSSLKTFIDAMNETYYSFYRVEEVYYEKALVVKDILLGTTHTVKEKEGTHFLDPGDIVFSRILTMDEQSIFVGMAPILIPGRFSGEIFDHKEEIIDEEGDVSFMSLWGSCADKTRELFVELLDAIYDDSTPSLRNTDGDELVFAKSYFDLSLSPGQALTKLLPLTLSENENDFHHDAVFDSEGEITKVDFPWLTKENNMGWDNIVLGHIEIDKDKLILETNSNSRTEQGKNLLAEMLGENIKFKQTLFESVEMKMQDASNKGHEQVQHLPEELEQSEELQKHIKAHWEAWFDAPIPMLGDVTPRQAAKTPSGRERLEALLMEYQKRDAAASGNLFKANIPYLRSELGL